MPELPDILVYVDALAERLAGQILEKVVVRSPSLVCTYDPPVRDLAGKRVLQIERIGKRLVFAFEGDVFMVVHLMIAGRFHWKKPGTLPTGKFDHATFGFAAGTLALTEASTKKRAQLHVVRGRGQLVQFVRGGLDPLSATPEAFAQQMRSESHTLKRSLTDPRLFDGIGNAYSDEILHAARLSPLTLSTRLTDEEMVQLQAACVRVLNEWIERLQAQARGAFPEKVTAFRPEMAAHGRFGQPCPACQTKIQRIRYADNETNYCPRCQTGGKLLADRALSRLLKDTWPDTIEELEARKK
jgi:formamidopyrimidine-DNA glycosylase